ncbi:MAG: tripartite tricarboxylate transporter TctB family protein [Dysosmobacter welbionis]
MPVGRYGISVHRANSPGAFQQKETRSSPFAFKTVGFKRMVLVSLTLIATGAIIYFLGIYIGILFMLPVCMFIHGERNVKLLAGLTVVICVFVWLSFDVALRVPLPMGTLFS